MAPVAAVNAALRRVPVWPLYVLGILPPVWLLWSGLADRLGADPVKVIEHRLGLWGLWLLVAVLCVTPLRRYAGLNLLRFRRAAGLLAFFYILLHLLTWLVLDMGLLLGQALEDIAKRPYITIGMASFLAMVPLAATSNDLSVRRLGAAGWRRLHMLTYPVALLGALHFAVQTKTWQMRPLAYLAVVAGLVALRLAWLRAPGLAPGRRRGA
ncbi:MAG: protein-methionine-sulfoxide reductase heme-binding subunit MsrQ [Rhodobacteraceae bacterium]|nr:protein-methionine-sulfoxide reductase heme-binding subunit MsrQ [Paracoccaceae bacterium]